MNLFAEHLLQNDPDQVRQLASWVEDFAQRAQLSAAVRQSIDLALEEWVTNVLGYAWPDRREHWMTIRFLASPSEARVEVEDDGREFNPLAAPLPDVNAPLETRPIGGLGLHMIRQLMDAVDYRRMNGRNILTLIKRTS